MILDIFCVHDPSIADGRYDSSESFTGDVEDYSDDFYRYLLVDEEAGAVRIFDDRREAEAARRDGEALLQITYFEYSTVIYGDGCYYQTIIESQEVLAGECSVDFTGESDWAFYYD